LASDFCLNIYKRAKTIDLCAGIGGLAFAAYHYQDCTDITCVELNPIYYGIGRKLLLEAKWINDSIFNYKSFGHFAQCISTPPSGKIKTGIDESIKSELKYKGAEFDLITIEIASKIADYGCFILPQQSTPFKYSGQLYFIDTRIQSPGYNPHGLQPPAKVQKFIYQTGFDYQFNIGVDTSVYKDDWKGVSPVCEIVYFEWNGI
jgi:hypothetical protein